MSLGEIGNKKIESILGDKSIQKKPLTGVYSLDLVTAMEKVAGELGLPFRRLAEAGEKYTGLSGNPDLTVAPESVLIQMGTGQEKNFSDFWKKVDQICPSPWVKP